jgi:ligand-binding SRPBCC domain-containing protein
VPSERLQFQQRVPFPLDHVFAFFSNPLNLPRIMPTDSGAKIEQLNRVAPPDSRGAAADVAAGVGSTMVTRFASFLFFRCARGGSPGSPNSNRIITSLVRRQEEGPFKNWRHRHQFLAETRSGIAGTVVRDVID